MLRNRSIENLEVATGLSTEANMAMSSYCTSSRVQRQSTVHAPKNSGEEVMVGMKTENNSFGWSGNLMLMMELRKKILVFRDTTDIPPCNGSSPIHELVMGTVEDLHNLYPSVVSYNLDSEMEQISIDQGLYLLYNALKCVGDSWAKKHKWIWNLGQDSEECLDNISLEQLGRKVLEKLKYTTDMAKEIFDMMDEDEKKNNIGRIQGSTIGDTLLESYSDKKISCPSPNTTTSIPPQLTTFDMKMRDFADMSYSRPLLLPLRLQALGNLKPNGMKSLSFNKSPPRTQNVEPEKEIQKVLEGKEAPPRTQNVEPEKEIQKVLEGKEDSKKTENLPKFRPSFDSNAISKVGEPIASPSPPLPQPLKSSPPPINEISVPSLPPPINQPQRGPTLPSMAMTKVGTPPPPPPIGVVKLLRPKKANNKLKRSSQMGNLYRTLKGKVEGSSLNGRHSHGRKSHIGGSAAGGKQGMADALAEMTKRSAYFQQIEEDVQKHSKSIMEIKEAMNSFQTKDMAELIRFHKYVEQHLEKLTDETQVLARFEGFPTKKLESLRIAAALYMKLKGIIQNLESWKVDPPLGMLLDKVESYFNKIKGEIDALDRSKDEDSKRFQSHGIHFDFNILVKIKESMVDVSSSCMELALEGKRKAKEAANAENGSETEGQAKHVKMLWRAFQLAFRVYGFAGGQDDRAEMLSKKLALEIQTIDP